MHTLESENMLMSIIVSNKITYGKLIECLKIISKPEHTWSIHRTSVTVWSIETPSRDADI